MVSSCSGLLVGENRAAFTLVHQEVTLLPLPVACTFAFQSVFSFSCCSACAARFPAVPVLHKLVSAAASFFCSSRRFPVPLVQNFPSLVLFFFFPLSLSHCPPVPNNPPPPTPQCHRVHMAPACDMKPCQNTPDALFNLHSSQPLLNFKQNKRERGRCWWGLKGGGGGKGGVGGEHVVPRKCATASQSYSFTGSPGHHHRGRAALIFFSVTFWMCNSLTNLTNLTLPSIHPDPTNQDSKSHHRLFTLCYCSCLFPCINCYYLRNART